MKDDDFKLYAVSIVGERINQDNSRDIVLVQEITNSVSHDEALGTAFRKNLLKDKEEHIDTLKDCKIISKKITVIDPPK